MHSSELFLHANVYLLQTHGISQKKRLALDIYFCKQLRNFCYMMCTYLPPSFCNLREKEMIQIREAGGRKYAYYGGVIWSVSGRPFEAVVLMFVLLARFARFPLWLYNTKSSVIGS